MINKIRLVVAAGLVGAALLAGLVASIGGAKSARREIHAQASMTRVGGRVDAFRDHMQAQFVVFVAQLVPPHDPIRIVMPHLASPSSGAPVPPRTGCGYPVSLGTYGWLVYTLAPRASVCDSSARWTVYFDVVPPEHGMVYRFAGNYAVARR